MKALHQHWASLTFQKKLVFIFMPLALIPMIFLTAVASWMYGNRLTKSLDGNAANTVRLVNGHLNTYLDELTRLSVLPYYNSKILDTMTETGTISDTGYNEIQNLLTQAIRNPREDLQSVFIYRRDSQIFYTSTYKADINYDFDYQRSNWYRKAVEANGQVVFIGKTNDNRVFNRPEASFSVARAIKVYNGPILGVIIIDVNFTGFESIFRDADLGADSNIVVMDQNRNVVYSKNDHYLSALSGLAPSRKSVRFGNDKLIVNQVDSANTGWKIVGIVSESELNRGKVLLFRIILTISAVVFAIVMLVSILLANTITKPLKTLRRLMGRVEMGDFNVAYQSLSGNLEIGQVGRAFNKMNERIDELVNQVLESRYKQKEAELNTLKLQIRPHFLFNNLEAIRALAEMGDREGVAEITTALGGMLRYSLNKQNAKVALREEVRQVRDYMRIEQIRSGHTLEIEYDLDPELLSCLTIPILLQPVAENCIHHGFDQMDGIKRIELAVASYEEGIRMTIRDNGIGMTPDRLAKLNAYLADEAEELSFGNSGIGLKNLHARIRLEYGPLYGLVLSSEEGEGMTVEIRIPRTEGGA